MKSPILPAFLVAGCLACLAPFGFAEDEDGASEVITNYREAKSPLDFGATSIHGDDVKLSNYKGSVLLIVNTASHCGFTPQYKGLQQLYSTYKDRGFLVLGFPCNEFGRQEPGNSEKILSFCKENYGVTFPLFSKVRVLGRRATPLYRFLASKDTNEKFGGPINWNFTKFLVNRKGEVVGRFESKVSPDDEKFLKRIQEEIEKKAEPVDDANG